MKRKYCIKIFTVILLTGLLVNCPNGNDGNVYNKIKIGYISRGEISINLYDKSAYDGLLRYGKDTGSDIILVESDMASYSSGIMNLINKNCDLIVSCISLDSELKNLAIANPKINFCFLDNYVDINPLPPNVVIASFTPSHAESSFLVGYIAGKMTAAKKVGHINGVKGNIMEEFAVGYYAGVLTADPAVQISGKYSGSFSSPETGKSMASNYFDSGIDIIFSAAGVTGNGVIEAAKEKDKWAIGVDIDQNYLAPENVLTSAINRLDVISYFIAESVSNKTFEGGKLLLCNLKNNGVGYTTTGSHIPQNIITEVELLKQKVISGEKIVPVTVEDFNILFPGKYNMEE
jgi:basic membrane protein A